MMDDVHDAIFDLVELIKTYQSKNRLSQLLMSTLFRRRQDEMGAVVDRAILSLQVSGIGVLTKVLRGLNVAGYTGLAGGQNSVTLI